jgi:hypothetical protein
MEEGWPCWSRTEETTTATERSPKWTGDTPPCAVVTVANEIHSQGMKWCVRESVVGQPVTCLWSLAGKFAEESDRGGGNGG